MEDSVSSRRRSLIFVVSYSAKSAFPCARLGGSERLSDPDGVVAKAEVGEANYFVSAICEMTGNQPASICAEAVAPNK
jgi:hypothetical protein